MTRFRPCIDLHAGQVKQIVGGTLSNDDSELKTNHVSLHPAGYFSELYRDNDLRGAHVIMLGPKNDDAAEEALAAWPGGLQVGGGITDRNAREWIDKGAEKVSEPPLSVSSPSVCERVTPRGCVEAKTCASRSSSHLTSSPRADLAESDWTPSWRLLAETQTNSSSTSAAGGEVTTSGSSP